MGGQSNHVDPDPLYLVRDGVLLPYSLDLDNYEPRCVSCHRTLGVKENTA
jgi:hypothetical protein